MPAPAVHLDEQPSYRVGEVDATDTVVHCPGRKVLTLGLGEIEGSNQPEERRLKRAGRQDPAVEAHFRQGSQTPATGSARRASRLKTVGADAAGGDEDAGVRAFENAAALRSKSGGF